MLSYDENIDDKNIEYNVNERKDNKLTGGLLGDCNRKISYKLELIRTFNRNIIWCKDKNIKNKNKNKIILDTESYSFIQHRGLSQSDNMYFYIHKEGVKTLYYPIDNNKLSSLCSELYSHCGTGKEVDTIMNNKNGMFNEMYPRILVYIFSIDPNQLVPVGNGINKYIVGYNKNNGLYLENINGGNYFCIPCLKNKQLKTKKRFHRLSRLILTFTAIHEILLHLMDNWIYENLQDKISIKLSDKLHKISGKNYNNFIFISKFGKDDLLNFENNILTRNKIWIEQTTHKILNQQDILLNYEFGVVYNTDIDMINELENFHKYMIKRLTEHYFNVYCPTYVQCFEFEISMNNILRNDINHQINVSNILSNYINGRDFNYVSRLLVRDTTITDRHKLINNMTFFNDLINIKDDDEIVEQQIKEYSCNIFNKIVEGDILKNFVDNYN